MSSARERVRELGIPHDPQILRVAYMYDWLRSQPACVCCGVVFATGPKFDGQKQDASPSLDRIIPAGGYTQGNVALICWRCNNLKRDATGFELLRVAIWTLRVTIGIKAAVARNQPQP